jgi:fluoride exporter
MKPYLYVFIGGGLGSIVRFLLGKSLNPVFATFPLGTFLSNITASFLVGFLFTFSYGNDNRMQLIHPLLITGFCGGFSTFSSFTMEGFNLLREEYYFHFALYTAASFLVCFLGVFIGVKTGNLLK